MSQRYQQEVRQFVIENFLFGEDKKELTNDASFLEQGVIDSTGVLELVMYLERQFGIKVGDEELLPENLDSVNQLALFITRKEGLKTVNGHAS